MNRVTHNPRRLRKLMLKDLRNGDRFVFSRDIGHYELYGKYTVLKNMGGKEVHCHKYWGNHPRFHPKHCWIDCSTHVKLLEIV